MKAFEPVSRSLELELAAHYAQRGERTDDPARSLTLATNSSLVERRAAPLVEMLDRFGGVPDLRGRRVIDLGCGFGALAVYFAALGGSVTGVDPNGERLEVGAAVARTHSLDVTLKQGRMEALPVPDATYDVAVLNNSLCYLVDRGDRAAALGHVHRVLRPGGTVVVRNPNRWHPFDQFTGLPALHLLPPEQATALAGRIGRPRSYCRVISPPAARRELKRAGFEALRQPGFMARGSKPQALKVIARYQHFVASRPKRPYGVLGVVEELRT